MEIGGKLASEARGTWDVGFQQRGELSKAMPCETAGSLGSFALNQPGLAPISSMRPQESKLHCWLRHCMGLTESVLMWRIPQAPLRINSPDCASRDGLDFFSMCL